MKLRVIALIYLILIAACVGITREELEAEALQTGDWSKVERREAKERIEAQWAALAEHCQVQEKVLVCDGRFSRKNPGRGCGCADRDAFNGLMQ